ncbi:MAG: hypothetical protein ACTSRG_00710 [Candidatus Helarchaeota archaeon]
MSNILGNRWKIALAASAFNLLFEYSMRGINDLIRSPFLPLALFLIYLSLFTMLEDLILRYKLRDYQLILLSFFYGTIYIAFASSILFSPPLLFGINFFALLFVNFFWWGILQGILTFYLANRIVERDWEQPPLSKLGWFLAVIINGSIIFVFVVANPFSYNRTFEGLITMCILLITFGCLSYLNIKNTRNNENFLFESSKILDLILITTISLFAFCAIFLISDSRVVGGTYSNQFATFVVIIWTTIVGIILTLYRIIQRKQIHI